MADKVKKSRISWKLASLLLVPTLVLAASKTTPENDYRKGLELYSQGRYESALVRFQLAIDERWNFWQSYQMVGYCFFELRDKEEALTAFDESLKINPDNPKLTKIVKDLREGTLDIPVRPVEAQALPVGTPVSLQTYYSFNR